MIDNLCLIFLKKLHLQSQTIIIRGTKQKSIRQIGPPLDKDLNGSTKGNHSDKARGAQHESLGGPKISFSNI